jgi:hypothetical protein
MVLCIVIEVKSRRVDSTFYASNIASAHQQTKARHSFSCMHVYRKHTASHDTNGPGRKATTQI